MVKTSYKQTFIGIWFHDKNLSSDLQYKMQLELNKTFHYYRIFVNEEDFYTYIDEERLVAKIFLIVSISDSSLDSIVKLAEQCPKVFEKVYNFSRTQIPTSTCFNTTSIDDLFKRMSNDIQEYINKTTSPTRPQDRIFGECRPVDSSLTERPSPSISVFNPKIKQNTPIRHLTKESLNFLCFLTMTDILRRISSYTSEELMEMWTSCRDQYKENQIQLDYIDRLQCTYTACEVIKYYTGNSCLSRTVNKACHAEDMKELFTYRVYISDLHKKLNEYDRQQENNDIKSCIKKVYRGKPLSSSVLQQLIDNEGGLISMNGFLSTTIARDVALKFAGDIEQISEGQKSILFMLEIDKQMKQPYAYISDCSDIPDELEVLFSLGTIWRIKSIKLDEDPCIIELISCDELDSQSNELLKKYTENGCNLSSLGDILYELGNDGEAEWFYNKMLKQDSLDDMTRANLYYKIGKIRFEKGDNSVALENYKKAEKLFPASVNESDSIQAPQRLYVWDNQSPSIAIHNTMGIIYGKDGDFEKAIDCYKKALEVQNGSPSETAIVHDNLGLLLYHCGKYKEAREHHFKAVENSNEIHPKRVEFTRNLDRADQRCQHLREQLQEYPS